MKKRRIGLGIPAVLLCVFMAVACCSACGKSKTKTLSVEQSTYTVEYGDTFVMPDVTANGKSVAATFTVTDAAGNPVAVSYGMFTPEVGTYTVTAESDGYKSVAFTVTCVDTTPPEISFSTSLQSVLAGSSVVLPTFTATDRSGVKEGSVSARLIAPSGASQTYAGGESVTVSEVGEYRYVATATDIYDNAAEKENKFITQNGNIDAGLTGTQIFNFDTQEQLALVLAAQTDEGTAFAVTPVAEIKDEWTNETYPKADGVGDPSGAALAATVQAGKKAVFAAQMPLGALNKAPVCDDTKYVYIRFASLGRFTEMTVSHVTDERVTVVRTVTPYDNDYENQMTWYEAKLEAGKFGMDPDDKISRLEFEIVNFSAQNVTVYIDEIFYEAKPAYTAPSGSIVRFDDAKTVAFADGVTAPFGSAGAELSIVTENVPQKNGEDVASALRVHTTRHMQGVYFTFPHAFEIGYYDSVTLSMYSEYLPERFNIGYVDSYGNFTEWWCTPTRATSPQLACAQGWKEYTFNVSEYSGALSGNIIGMYVSIYEIRDKYFLERYPDFDGSFDLYVDEIRGVRYDETVINDIENKYFTDNSELGGKNVITFDAPEYAKFLSNNVTAEYVADCEGSHGGAFVAKHTDTYQRSLLTYTPPRVVSAQDTYALKVRYKGSACMYATDSTGTVYYWNLQSNAAEDGDWKVATCLLTVVAGDVGDNPHKGSELLDFAKIALSSNVSGGSENVYDYIVAIPFVDRGTASVTYDGAEMGSVYYTTDEFDWSKLAATSELQEADYIYTLSKDGGAAATPANGTLAAGEYTLTVFGTKANESVRGEARFTVSAPAQADITLTNNGESTFVANETLALSDFAANSDIADLTYTYTIVAPNGVKYPFTDGFGLSQSGTYTITVTGAKRGYAGQDSVTVTVQPATQLTIGITYDGNVIVRDTDTLRKSDLTVTGLPQDVQVEWQMTFGDTTEKWTSDTYAFTQSGTYTFRAVVTTRGYEGSAEIAFTCYVGLPESAVVLASNLGPYSGTYGWGQNTFTVASDLNVPVHKDGTIAMRVKLTPASRVYIGINGMGNDGVGMVISDGTYADYTVVRTKISALMATKAAWNELFGGDGNVTLTSLQLRLWCSSSITEASFDWIAYVPPAPPTYTDLPDGATVIASDVGTFSAASSWAGATVQRIPVSPNATIVKTGSIAIRFKQSLTGSVYIGFNDMTESDLVTVNTVAQAEFTVITVSIAEKETWTALFGAGDTLDIHKLCVRLSPAAGNVVEIDWVAFVPATT